MRYEYLTQHPNVFVSATGLRVNEFDQLIDAVQARYVQAEHERLARPDRQRSIGGGQSPVLSSITAAVKVVGRLDGGDSGRPWRGIDGDAANVTKPGQKQAEVSTSRVSATGDVGFHTRSAGATRAPRRPRFF